MEKYSWLILGFILVNISAGASYASPFVWEQVKAFFVGGLVWAIFAIGILLIALGLSEIKNDG